MTTIAKIKGCYYIVENVCRLCSEGGGGGTGERGGGGGGQSKLK